ERVEIIRDVAHHMETSFEANPFNLIEEAERNTPRLLEILVTRFESFLDKSTYKQQTVYFNKRAQLLCSDINHILTRNGAQGLQNVDMLTACADYKIPFILRRFGILQYSKQLSSIIDEKVLIARDSELELEIRSLTIH